MSGQCQPATVAGTVLLALLGLTTGAAGDPPTLQTPVEGAATDPHFAAPVAVEIIEGLPDNRSWDFSPAGTSEQYAEPALAFVDLPKKYSSRGIVAARTAPFLLRAVTEIQFPPGEYRFLLRARGAGRLFIDDAVVLQTLFRNPNADGHESVPKQPAAREASLRPLPPGHQEQLATVALDGGTHQVRLELIVGDQKLRPEVGELSVSVAAPGQPFVLLSPSRSDGVPLTDEGWNAYAAVARVRLKDFDRRSRRQAAAGEKEYWDQRHEIARRIWTEKRAPTVTDSADASLSVIDRFIAASAPDGQTPPPLVDDYAFLRRATLDTVGVIPAPDEIAGFLALPAPERRAKAIERLLADERWADHWVSYWQDVLAENPGILKPELNNTGPFRWWIHEALVDNKPLDRFATELLMLEGGLFEGGPAGFGMASQNDAPLAEKAHVVAKAFLAVELKCARCHDAPLHPFKQEDTFSLAAMLGRGVQTLPKTSTVQIGGRQPLVEITLKPGDKIQPAWPFPELAPGELPPEWLRNKDDARERLAALMTSPHNERFAQVIVNRLWKRYVGWGLVEPVDDWHETEPSHPELLHYLAYELVTHGYDLKHVAGLILNSQVYQREAQSPSATEAAAGGLMAPLRRRLSAEQLVDSLFFAAGKPIGAEELTFDPEGRRPAGEMLNLGVPRRAWQFASLSNERDRPALSLAVAQNVVDVLTTFGWRESRQNPLTERDDTPNPLQALTLANGVVGNRIARLSSDSRLTQLCLEETTPEQLVERTFLQLLSRPPSPEELDLCADTLRDGFAERRLAPPAELESRAAHVSAVSWSNHLSPEASRIKLELEKAAREGDPPTPLLVPHWRERMEDVVWALVNSPEFMFVP